jgi:large subunit ribosomal protein L15
VSTGVKIGSLRPAAGATHAKKRRGKGAATGLGGTAGKGHKGKKARAGGKIPAWFEGGQMPLQRRLPKRGFKNPMRVEHEVVNVGRLAAAPAGTTVDRAWLESSGLVRRPGPIKLLGNGELKVALAVKVEAASGKARQIVEGAGGTVEILVRRRRATAISTEAPGAAKPSKPSKPPKPSSPKPPSAEA